MRHISVTLAHLPYTFKELLGLGLQRALWIVLLGSGRGRWHVLGRSDHSDTRALTLSHNTADQVTLVEDVRACHAGVVRAPREFFVNSW